MDWVFIAFLGVSLAHMGEEYVYPGSFMDFMKRLNPRFAPMLTARFAIIINGLQLVLCLIALAVGRNSLAISLSVASLLFLNGMIHIIGSIRIKGYAPGVVTGVVLYLPLSVYAYYLFWSTGQLTLWAGVISGLLGLGCQMLPLSYLRLSSVARQV